MANEPAYRNSREARRAYAKASEEARGPLAHDANQLHAWFDAALLAAFLAAAHLAGMPDRAFYISIDGTDRPFYGDHETGRPPAGSRRYKKWLDRRTEAGRHAEASFAGKGDTGSRPKHAGTTRAHHWLMMNAHLAGTFEAFPLAWRRGKATPSNIAELVKVLDALPMKPFAIVADKEFCHATKLVALRAWCDRNKVILLLAKPRDSAERTAIEHAWYNGSAQPMKGSPKPRYWAVTERYWTRHAPSKAPPYRLFTVYDHDDPRKDFDDSLDVQRLPNGIWAISWYTNIEVTPENAYFLYELYRGRWGAESLHRMWKSYSGASFAHTMFLRDFVFGSAMLIQSTYALWRIHRRQAGRFTRSVDWSRSAYYPDIHDNARQRLVNL